MKLGIYVKETIEFLNLIKTVNYCDLGFKRFRKPVSVELPTIIEKY